MKLNQLMTKNVVTVRPDDSLATAARTMRERNIGFLPVCDGDRLVGTLTDRDITVNAVADGKDPKATQVRDLVHSNVFWCFEDQDVREAARIMEENQVRRLMVLNPKNKQLSGIVSLGDLAMNADKKVSAKVLEKVSEKI